MANIADIADIQVDPDVSVSQSVPNSTLAQQLTGGSDFIQRLRQYTQ
jgi:hypothetical protein